MDNRIYRSRDTKMISGVCGGIADMFNIDPTLVRLVAAALTIFSGFTFLLVYILCAIIIPLEPSPGYILRRHQQPSAPMNTSRGPANTVQPSDPKMEDVQPVEEKPIQPVDETPVKAKVSNAIPEAYQTDAQTVANESNEFKNDETVINSQADKY